MGAHDTAGYATPQGERALKNLVGIYRRWTEPVRVL